MPQKAAIEPSKEGDEFVPLLELFEQQKAELAAVRSSTSWRLMAPVRRFLDLLRGNHKS